MSEENVNHAAERPNQEPATDEEPVSAEARERCGPTAPEESGTQDSVSFSRCAGCKYSAEVDSSSGTLLCTQHDMRINAEADEIPDDCVAYEPADEARTDQGES